PAIHAARESPTEPAHHHGYRADLGARNKRRRLWSESVAPPAQSFVGPSVRCPRRADALRQKRKPASVFPGHQFPEDSRITPRASKAKMSRKPLAIFASIYRQQGC